MPLPMPKHATFQYGFIVRTDDGCDQYKIKVKGLSLNHSVSEIINYGAMRELVVDYDQTSQENAERIVKFNQITRTSDFKLVTVAAQKRYRVVYTKRKVLPDFSTLPWGYQ